MGRPPPPPPMKYPMKTPAPKPVVQEAPRPVERDPGTSAAFHPQPEEVQADNRQPPVKRRSPEASQQQQQQQPNVSAQPQHQFGFTNAAHQQAAIDELTRENNLLAARVADFFSPDGDQQDPIGVDVSSPPPLLMARIKRLEMALQLEAIAREELETRCAAQDRLVSSLIDQLETAGIQPQNPFRH